MALQLKVKEDVEDGKKSMYKRILFSAVFIPLLFLVVIFDFFHGLLFFLFICLVSFLAGNEFFNLLIKVDKTGLSPGDRAWFVIPAPATIIMVYINNIFGWKHFNLLYLAGFFTIFLFTGILITRKNKKSFRIFLFAVSSLIYTGFFPLSMFLLHREPGGRFLVCMLFILGWMNDSSAYFIGYYFGRTRGIIKWSPNKSLEGYIGASVITILIAVSARFIMKGFTLYGFSGALIVGLLFSFTAPAGDLFESWLKRKALVKDSSSFLPGMGGVLDIFDSIFMSAPFYYIFIKSIY